MIDIYNVVKNNRAENDDPRNGRYDITPQIAEDLLRNNVNNPRKIRWQLVDKYAYDMAHKKWVDNGEPIVFCKETEELLDGQHRLHGVIKSGETVRMYIIFDTPKTRRFDYGALRSTADETKLPTIANQIGGTILRFVKDESTVSKAATVEFSLKHKDYLLAAEKIICSGRSMTRGRKLGSKASCGAVVSTFLKAETMSADEMEMFFRVINSGNIIGCTKNSSAPLRLMVQFMNMKGGGSAVQKAQLEMTYKALIDFKNDKQLREDEVYTGSGDAAQSLLRSTFGEGEE